MKQRYDQKSWQLECGKASKNGTLNELMKSLTRGDVEVTDDSGQPISFAPPPDRLGPSPLPPFPVRDRGGNIVQEAAPAKSDAAPKRISRGSTLENRQSFEEEIQYEPEATKASLRLQYDALRKQHGIN